MSAVRKLTLPEIAELGRSHYAPYTPPLDAMLRAAYRTVPLDLLAAACGRSPASIQRRASLLGLRRSDRPLAPAPQAKRRWTAADDDLIREQYGTGPTWRLARQLGRSEVAVRVRAKRLGINAAVNVWSARQLADLFGVDSHVPERWRAAGLLTGRRSIGAGPHRRWAFDGLAVERFIQDHPAAYNRRRIQPGYWRDLAEQTWQADPLLTVPEVAALHGVSPTVITAHIRRGRLAAERGHGANQPWYVRRSAALTWTPLRPELVGHRGRGAPDTQQAGSASRPTTREERV